MNPNAFPAPWRSLGLHITAGHQGREWDPAQTSRAGSAKWPVLRLGAFRRVEGVQPFKAEFHTVHPAVRRQPQPASARAELNGSPSTLLFNLRCAPVSVPSHPVSVCASSSPGYFRDGFCNHQLQEPRPPHGTVHLTVPGPQLLFLGRAEQPGVGWGTR